MADGEFKPVKSVHHTHAGSIGNLCNDRVAKKFYSIYDLIAR